MKHTLTALLLLTLSSTYGQEVNNISIIRLIATPEKYHNEIVQITGFLNIEFEGDAIYLHKEDHDKSLLENSMWVDFSDELKQKVNLEEYNRQYVILKGTFDKNDTGHLGLFGGAIKDITRLDIWGDKKK